MSEEIIKEKAEFGEVGSEKQVNTFFLACECKPNTPAFSILDPFVYDIQPAWIYGSLGILHYDPAVYGIVTTHDDGDPIFGYIMTISHPDTITLLDRMKGVYGKDGFNMHTRNLVVVNLSDGKEVLAWAYTISPNVISAYESIEQVENGLWDNTDSKLLDLEQQFDGDDPEEDDDDEDEEDEEDEDEEDGGPDEPVS